MQDRAAGAPVLAGHIGEHEWRAYFMNPLMFAPQVAWAAATKTC